MKPKIHGNEKYYLYLRDIMAAVPQGSVLRHVDVRTVLTFPVFAVDTAIGTNPSCFASTTNRTKRNSIMDENLDNQGE